MTSILKSNKQIETNGITFDFSDDKLSIYGSSDIRYDKSSLQKISSLLEILKSVSDELKELNSKGLLEEDLTTLKVATKRNPFE